MNRAKNSPPQDLLDRLWSLVAFSAFASFFSRFMEAIPSYLAYSRKLFDHDMYELEAARLLLYLLVASYTYLFTQIKVVVS